MATNRDLLKEAIADAKAVKEAAIANAKVALEEAFTPFLKEKLALTLSEMDEDLDEAETDELEEYLLNNPSPEGEGNAFSRQPHGNLEEDDMTEGEMDLEELLRELEEDSDTMYEEEITEAEEGGDEEGGDEEVTLEDMTEDDLKALIEDVISDMVEAGELEAGEGAGEEEMGSEEEMEDSEEVDLDELLYEIKKEKMKKMRPSAKAETEELEEAKKKAKKAEMEKEKAEKELKEALETIKSIQSSLQEVKLLNAKLLYTNKIFNSRNLTEDQRIKVLTSFDKAASVKEAKLVYETLLEGLKPKRTPIKEHMLGSASRTVINNAKQPIIESNDQFARWQKLAGIKKSN